MIDFYEFKILSPFPLKTKDDLNSWLNTSTSLSTSGGRGLRDGKGRKENYSVSKCEPEKYFYPNSIFFDKYGNIFLVPRHLLL